MKKHTKHGKKKGGNQTKHFENEKHSLQGKSGKVSLAPLPPRPSVNKILPKIHSGALTAGFFPLDARYLLNKQARPITLSGNGMN